MYEYQSSNIYFAQVTGMMEGLGQQELQELGATDTKLSYRGVYFKADHETLYRINYISRLLSRVLAPLKNFYCDNTGVLKKTADTIEWDDFLTVDNTFSITSSVANSKINNSLYASQCLKDGIADYFRNKFGKRPDVDTVNPDVRFNLFIEKDAAVISLDTSGESLHKRGYRLLAGEAPMQETLAAAIIQLSNWDGQNTLWDPMCGSGTILCEALMHYCRIPAQKLRKNFGFFHLPDFDKNLWEKIKEESDSKIRPLPKGLIKGSDKSQKIIEVANDNLSRLPYSNNVQLECHPFQHVKQFNNGTIITNPPYGIRLGDPEEVKDLYRELGDFLKQNCTGTSAFIYTGEPSLRKYIGLKTSRRIHLVNGKLEGVLLQIDSYEGTKKKYYLRKGDEKAEEEKANANVEKAELEKAKTEAKAKEERFYDRFDVSRKNKFGKKDEERNSRRFESDRKNRWEGREKTEAKVKVKEDRFGDRFDVKRKNKFGKNEEERNNKRFESDRKNRWEGREKTEVKVKEERFGDRFDVKKKNKFRKNEEVKNNKRFESDRKNKWGEREKAEAKEERFGDRFDMRRKEKFGRKDEDRKSRSFDERRNDKFGRKDEDRKSRRFDAERKREFRKEDSWEKPGRRFEEGENFDRSKSRSKGKSKIMSKSKNMSKRKSMSKIENGEFKKKSDDKKKNTDSFFGVKEFGMRKGKGRKR